MGTPLPTESPANGAVPQGFVARSVSFPSPELGWVLGDVPCARTRCVLLLRTTDGGATWRAVRPPPVLAPSDANYDFGAVIVFADSRDGWEYSPFRHELSSTHNGGSRWSTPLLPGAKASYVVAALAATSAGASLVVGPGLASASEPQFAIYDSPVSHDQWRRSSTTIPFGAGPIPSIQLLREGSAGWILENDRLVVAGARLVNGSWVNWNPPCTYSPSTNLSYGEARLAATSGSQLAAACFQSPYGASFPAALFQSSDGGATFLKVAGLPTLNGPTFFASPVLGVCLFEDFGDITATFDSGANWEQVAMFPTTAAPGL
jgi:hypothetical protein